MDERNQVEQVSAPIRPLKALFLDIGNVLLTNGWDREARYDAALHFDLDAAEVDERHHLTFDTYEEGELSLDEYLDRVIFYRARPFKPIEFKEYMFSRSESHQEMIELMLALKGRYKLRVVAVSNEGRELTVYRIRKFHLSDLFDTFICSSFVHLRKPDEKIYRLAMDASQVDPDEAVYVDDRQLFVEVAQGLGMSAILHTGYESTKTALENLGLVLPPQRGDQSDSANL